MTTWLVTALGAALVLLVLHDIFRTLWQPSGRGALTHAVMVGVWRLLRRCSRRERFRWLLDRAGPLAMITVIITWATLVSLGWALVYWPHLPGGFDRSSLPDPAGRSSLLDSVYLSMVTLATLGLGDILPTAGWLRVAVPLQALVGFFLLTAAVSWILQVYPALTRRRLLAVQLSLLRRATEGDLGAGADSPERARLVADLATALAHVRVDMSQYSETYYYREATPETSLPAVLGFLSDLADDATGSSRGDVRLGGALLRESLEDFCMLLRSDFGHSGDVASVLRSFADDHRYEVRTSPS